MRQASAAAPGAAARGICPCLVDDTVQVDGGGLLGVHADDVAAGLGKVCHAALRLHNHAAVSTCSLSTPCTRTTRLVRPV